MSCPTGQTTSEQASKESQESASTRVTGVRKASSTLQIASPIRKRDTLETEVTILVDRAARAQEYEYLCRVLRFRGVSVVLHSSVVVLRAPLALTACSFVRPQWPRTRALKRGSFHRIRAAFLGSSLHLSSGVSRSTPNVRSDVRAIDVQ